MKCKVCGGDMWDNRGRKLNPKQPDFKCKDKTCEGVIWPPKQTTPQSIDENTPVPSWSREKVPPTPEKVDWEAKDRQSIAQTAFKSASEIVSAMINNTAYPVPSPENAVRDMANVFFKEILRIKSLES